MLAVAVCADAGGAFADQMKEAEGIFAGHGYYSLTVFVYFARWKLLAENKFVSKFVCVMAG